MAEASVPPKGAGETNAGSATREDASSPASTNSQAPSSHSPHPASETAAPHDASSAGQSSGTDIPTSSSSWDVEAGVHKLMKTSRFKRLLDITYPGASALKLIESVGRGIATNMDELEHLLVAVAMSQAEAARAEAKRAAQRKSADTQAAFMFLMQASGGTISPAVSSVASAASPPALDLDCAVAALPPPPPPPASPRPSRGSSAGSPITLRPGVVPQVADNELSSESPIEQRPQAESSLGPSAAQHLLKSSDSATVSALPQPASAAKDAKKTLVAIDAAQGTLPDRQPTSWLANTPFGVLKRNQQAYAAYVQDCIRDGIAASDAFDRRQTRWHIPSQWQVVQRARRRQFEAYRREQESASFYSGETRAAENAARGGQAQFPAVDPMLEQAMDEHKAERAREKAEARRMAVNGSIARSKALDVSPSSCVIGHYAAGFNAGRSLVALPESSAAIRERAAESVGAAARTLSGTPSLLGDVALGSNAERLRRSMTSSRAFTVDGGSPFLVKRKAADGRRGPGLGRTADKSFAPAAQSASRTLALACSEPDAAIVPFSSASVLGAQDGAQSTRPTAIIVLKGQRAAGSEPGAARQGHPALSMTGTSRTDNRATFAESVSRSMARSERYCDVEAVKPVQRGLSSRPSVALIQSRPRSAPGQNTSPIDNAGALLSSRALVTTTAAQDPARSASDASQPQHTLVSLHPVAEQDGGSMCDAPVTSVRQVSEAPPGFAADRGSRAPQPATPLPSPGRSSKLEPRKGLGRSLCV